MGGGNWVTQNKVRPGTYINFKTQDIGALVGNRGIVAMPLDLNWGPENEVIEITNDTDTLPIFGYLLENIVGLREALKRATKVLAYRLNANTGDKATVTTGNLVATAKYSGTRGNDLDIVIISEGAGAFTAETYLDTTLVDSQSGAETVADLTNNDYVVFSGSGVLAATAGVSLASGTTAAVVAGDHSSLRTAIEPYEWNVLALQGVTDSAIKTAYKTFIADLRDNQGVKVQMVVENYPTADYEGVISLKNGVILADGTTLTAKECVAWIAGATAKAGTNESLTYDAYDDAIDVDTRYTNAQIIIAIESGEFLFVGKDNKARIEYDINTLITFTVDKSESFRKNRVLRALDGFANDSLKTAESNVIGKIDNNADGRNIYKTMLIKYIDEKVDNGTFTNFNANTDLEILAGANIDSILVNVALQPVDSVDKIYMTVSVN